MSCFCDGRVTRWLTAGYVIIVFWGWLQDANGMGFCPEILLNSVRSYGNYWANILYARPWLQREKWGNIRVHLVPKQDSFLWVFNKMRPTTTYNKIEAASKDHQRRLPENQSTNHALLDWLHNYKNRCHVSSSNHFYLHCSWNRFERQRFHYRLTELIYFSNDVPAILFLW